MRSIGIKCSKDKIDWALVEGTTAEDAVVLAQKHVAMVGGDRSEQLAWVRLEVLELVKVHKPERLALRVPDQTQGNSPARPSLGRSEADGVVQAAAAEAHLPCRRIYAATVKSAMKAGSKADVEAALEGTPSVAKTAKTRRDPVVAALCAILK